MIAGAIAIDIAPALCSHSALLSIGQITLNTFIREKFGHRTHQNQGNSDDGEAHKSSFPPAGKLFKENFHFLQKLVVPTFTFYKDMTNLPILWPRGPKRLVPMR